MNRTIGLCILVLSALAWHWVAPVMQGGIAGRRSPHDWTEFLSIQKEVQQEIQSALGLRWTGGGASAPNGIIYGWILAFQRYGIPTQEEARELVLKSREIAASVFARHPGVLPQMAHDYRESRLFCFQIFCSKLDGTEPGLGDISTIWLDYGSFGIEVVGEEGGYETVCSEPYADFLARFPDTKLKPYRELPGPPVANQESAESSGPQAETEQSI